MLSLSYKKKMATFLIKQKTFMEYALCWNHFWDESLTNIGSGGGKLIES